MDNKFSLLDFKSGLNEQSIEINPIHLKERNQEIAESLFSLVAKHLENVGDIWKLENRDKIINILKIRPITYGYCKLAFEVIEMTPSIVVVEQIGDSVNKLFYELEYDLNDRRGLYNKANVEFNPSPDEQQKYFTLAISNTAMEALQNYTNQLSESVDLVEKK